VDRRRQGGFARQAGGMTTSPPMGRPAVADARLLADLRTEVGWFRSGQVRRRFPAALQVGRLAGPRQTATLAEPPAYDAGLRADVVSRLLDRLPSGGPTEPAAWLTRPGDLTPQDADLAWLAASHLAFAMHGRAPAGFYVVTRAGWLDLRSGERRVWKRLRLTR
jgi:hypothetical protein